MMQQSIAKYQKMSYEYKQKYTKIKDDLDGMHWIISEKDTEIRVITKDKDAIQQKFLDQKLTFM